MQKNSGNNRRLVLTYVYLAASSFGVGVILVLVMLGVCSALDVDVLQNIWVLAIPVVLTLIINVLLIELYNKIRKR